MALEGGRKPWEPVESRLVAEWAEARYPNAYKRFNVRVGAGNPTLGESGMDADHWLASVGMFRRRADLVIELEDEVLLVEGKIVAQPVAIGELLLYLRLLPHTPEMFGIQGKRIVPVLLAAREDAAVSVLAREHGIRVELFAPDWVAAYLETRTSRARGGKVRDRAFDLEQMSGHSGGGVP